MRGERVEIELTGRTRQPAAGRGQGSAPAGLLVTLAVEDDTQAFGAAVDEQLRAVRAWWRDGPLGARFDVIETRAPRRRHDVELFLESAGLREAEPDVPLVLFVTGHGLAGAGSRHYLLLPESDRGRLLATTLPTCDVIVAALDSCAQDVLVIVNLCEAAGIGSELLSSMRDLAPGREQKNRLNVLATTGDRTAVLGLEFATILQEAHAWSRRAGGITRPHLSMAEFMEALRAATDTVNMRDHRRIEGPRPILTASLDSPTAAIPNPGYLAQASPLDDDLEPGSSGPGGPEPGHWLEKASGRPRPEDTGWYFSGREELNRQVADFLQGPAGVLIVTGTAASGKSAVLGRAVTLSASAFRLSEEYDAAVRDSPAAAVPPDGAITAAVSARNRSSFDLLEALCTALGAWERHVEQGDVRQGQENLRALLTNSASVVTIVVDSVDEALSPARCVSDVLAPLAALIAPGPALGRVPGQTGSAPRGAVGRGLRLLLGVRSSSPGPLAPAGLRGTSLTSVLHAAFPSARELRTDGEGTESDIGRYTRALLENADGWGEPERAEAADLVARQVQPSFLDAQRAAEQLRSGGPSLLRDREWLAQLADGTAGLLMADLRAAAGDLPPAEALALLRATAFAQGRGMAWGEVWPAAAGAILGHPLAAADGKIDRLLHSSLSGYLSHDVEDERIVYRPAHARLTDILRRSPPWTDDTDGGTSGTDDTERTPDGAAGDERAAHAAISTALARTSERTQGEPPPPYIRRHLAEHAQLGGVLDDAHVPVCVLPWETSGSIRGLLASTTGGGPRGWLEAYAVIEPYVTRADAASRLAGLHLAHTALNHPGVPHPLLPVGSVPPGSPLRVLWSWWTPPTNVLATTVHRVNVLAPVVDADGETLLATGDERGGIEFIDPATGGRIGDRLLAHDGAVRSLTSVRHPAGLVLASGSGDGTVRIREMLTGGLVSQVGNPGTVWADDVTGYLDGDGHPVVVSGKGDGTLTHWSETGEVRAPVSVGPAARICVTTVRREDGSLLLVSAGESLSAWSPSGVDALHTWPLSGQPGQELRVLAPTRRPGEVAAGHADGTVVVWDVTTGGRTILGGPGHPVTALVALDIGGRHVLAAGNGRVIDLWEIAGTRRAGRLAGHSDVVTALAALPLSGGDVLASTAEDRTVRLWDRAALLRALDGGTAEVHRPAVAALSADAGDTPLLAVATTESITLWDPRTGNPEGGTDIHPAGEPPALVWARRPSSRTLLWAAPDHSIRLWDADARRSPAIRLRGHTQRVTCLASCTTAEGREVVLSGGRDHRVALWDLDGPALSRTWSAHRLPVLAVAAASGLNNDWFASGSSDGTVCLWSVDDSAPTAVLACDQGMVESLAVNALPQAGLPPYLVSGGSDGSVRLWDLLTARPLGQPLLGHTASVDAVAAWSAEGVGPFVASASRDGTLRIWDAATGRALMRLAMTVPVRTLAARPSEAEPGRVTLTAAGHAGAVLMELDVRDL
ncbi:WD40 repeat domain-containing protein [Streptomyces sp. NBC_01693]|uniref:WD40 repeat domain-containing protein n=1 Tax=unclassified Streptomyces TaxID=2593676 RepID=UPI002E31AAA2|nr:MULTISPECIES: WD40 repeat domain-containing protein [unclassified Streptomyces]